MEKLIYKLIAIVTLLLSVSENQFAQTKVSSVLIKSDSITKFSDINDSLGIRTGKIKLSDEWNAKSGNLAMLLSAILPGSGQIYSSRYYTIPLIWGFGAYFSSIAIKSNNKYEDYKGKYLESVRLDTLHRTGDIFIKSLRDYYRNQRDEFIIYLALTYILNIVDAYVGATLYNFDVSDELGGSAAIRFKIPLR